MTQRTDDGEDKSRATGAQGRPRPEARSLDPASVDALEALFALDGPPRRPPATASSTVTLPAPPVPVPPIGVPPSPIPLVRPPATARQRRTDAVFRAPRWHWVGLVLIATALGGLALAFGSQSTPSTSERAIGSAAVAGCVLVLLCAMRSVRTRLVVSDEGIAVRRLHTQHRRWATVVDVEARRIAGGHALRLLLLDGQAEVLPVAVSLRHARAERVAADARVRRADAPRLLLG